MADYLLDTNILKYWYDLNCAEHSKVSARVYIARQPDPTTQYISRFFISVVTLAEMHYGHRVTLNPDHAKQTAYEHFVRTQCPNALEMTEHVAEEYGTLKAWLFNNCGPTAKKSKVKRAEELVHPITGKELGIDENDLWIAAQAKTHNLVLVTNDSKGNFGKVLTQFSSTLTVENWAV